MALSFEEFERLAKVWNNGQQIKQHEMQKQNMPAPKYNKVPTLESKKSERIKNDDMKSLAQSNDLMASQKSVKNTNNTLKQTNPLNKSLSNGEKPKSVSKFADNTTKNTLDMSKAPASNSLKGSSLKTEKAKRSYVNTEEVDKYLDSSYKLSKNETKRAKQMIDDYFDNNEKARKALQLSSSNPYQASKVRAQMSDRERKEYDKMTSLMNKSSNLSAYTYGALNIVPFGNTAMNKLGELAGGDSEYNYSAQKRNVKEQSPIAYGLGDMTSKLAAYATLGPALEKIPALTNFTNGLGTMATGGNAIGGEVLGRIMRGTLADVALDTIPTEVENYKNGMRGADLVEDATKNVLMNTLFNTGGEAASQLFTALKARKALKGATDVAEDAVRTTPKVNELDAERALADSRQNDWDALRAEMNRKPTNLEMEQASSVDEMDNLRRALAEQEALNNAPTPEVPRVGETPSLVAKEASNNVADIKSAIKEKNFKPVSFTINNQTYVISRSTRPNEKWQLSHIDDRGHFSGHSAFKNDDDLMAVLNNAKGIDNINFNGETPSILNSPKTTVSEMLQNPDKYTDEDFARAMRSYDNNADVDGATKEDIIDALTAESADYPDLLDMEVVMPNGVGDVAETVAKEAPAPTNTLSDDQISYYQKILNDKKFLNEEIKKAESMYKNNGMEMDKDTIKMELQDVARRNLREANVTPKNPKVTPITKGTSKISKLIDSKGMSSIQFKDTNAKSSFDNAMNEFKIANENFENALKNAEGEDDLLDAIDELESAYSNLRNATKNGYVTDNSGQGTLRNLKKAFKDNTKGMVINLPDSLRSEMGFTDKTMRQINSTMSSLGGNDYIKFSAKGGTPIDEVWDELVRASGGELDPNAINNADMANKLLEYVEGLKVADRGVEQFDADISNYIPDEYWDDIAKRASDTEQRLIDEGKVIASDEGLNPRTVVDDEYKIEGEVPTEPVPKSDLDYDLEFDTSMPERDATKVSKGYTNTGKNANGWNEAEYNKYTDPNNYTYESKQELESVNRATRMREDEGYDAFRNRILNKELGTMESEEVDGLMMDWRETIQEARDLEAMGEDASELWERSNQIFRKIQQEETHNAQALQALAKWSRNTPEGMLMQAEQIVNKKIQKGRPKKSEVQKELDKILKKHKDIEFSSDFQKKFLEEADSIFKMSDLNTAEAKDAMASLGKMVASELPVKLPDKVTAFLMDNMLGNFRTLITRNAGGNVGLNAVEQIAQRPLAAGIDKVVAKKTGVRTQAGLTKAGLMEYMGGFKKGLKDELHDMKTGLHTARTGENTMKNAIDANRHVFKEGGIMDKFDSLVKNGLSIGDRPFYEAVYNQTLGDYNRLRAMGQMGEAIQNLSDADFDKLAKTAANMNALSAVYQNDSTFAKAMLDFKNAVGELSEGTIGVDLLSQFTMPFVKTPANVVDRAIDYSPIGIVRNIIRTSKEGGIGGVDFDQNRFVNEASRNILGTGLMGGAAVGAKEGLFSGSYSDNKEEKQAQKRSGMQEYALNVPDWVPTLGGKQMDISWLPIVGSNAVAAAAAVDAFNKGEGNFIENVGTGLKAGGKALLDQSAYQGLQRLFGSDSSYDSDAGLIENALNTVKQGAGQAIPSLVRQLAQVTDPYQRDLANSNGGNYEFNSVVNSIPIARELLLAPKVGDNSELMRENQGRGVASKILEDMILPGKLTEVNENPLDVEAKRLSEETGNTKAYRPKASRSDVDTENHKLSNAEWVKYEQDLERATSDVGKSIMGSDYYYKASDPEKENILDNAYQDVKNAIKSEYSGTEIDGGAKIYKEAGGGEAGIKALTDYYQEKAYNKEVKDAMGSNSEWATQLYERNDPKELSDYKNAKALADAYGVNLTETNYLDYATYGADKLKQELNYAKRAKDIGVNNNDLFKELTDRHTNVNEIKRAFDDITSVTSGVDEYNRDKYLSFSKKNYDIYKNYGLEGLKDYAELAEEKVSYDIYRQAKQAIPSLTKSDYVATFHYMDGLTGSDPDGAISQKELLAYFNNQNVTANKAKEIWRAYGKVSGDNAWKSVPVLKYNKKTGKQEWSTTKKK